MVSPKHGCPLTLLGLPLPSTAEESLKDLYPEFNDVGRASGAYNWTLSGNGLTTFKEYPRGNARIQCNTLSIDSHIYSSGSPQYTSALAAGTQQPHYLLPPPSSTQAHLTKRSTPAIYHSGERSVAVAAENQPSARTSSPVSDAAAAISSSSLSPFLDSTSDYGNQAVDEGKRKLNLLCNSAFCRLIVFLYPQTVRKPETACWMIWPDSHHRREPGRGIKRRLCAGDPSRK